MFCPNCGSSVDDNANNCPNCGAPLGNNTQSGPIEEPQTNYQTQSSNPNPQAFTSGGPKSKLAAGLLGILLGSLGIHNFYIGNTKRGLIQLLVSLIAGPLTCGIAAIAMEIWGIVEGIYILTGKITTDANGVPFTE